MKKSFIIVLSLFMLISLFGCTKTTAPTPDDTTEEICETKEPAVSETATETEKTKETESTSPVTDEVLKTETEQSVDRVTEEVTMPVLKPVTQSYLEMYEPMDMDLANIEKYAVSDSEYSVTVIFEAKGDITDFKICGVEMTYGYDEITDTVLDIASLSDGEKIAVMLDFPGDMSSWYYSYTNNVGKRFECQIYMSGMDGSIVSTPWQ